MDMDKMRAHTAARSQHAPSEMPPIFATAAEEQVTDLDVREDLRRGEEPFSKIMQAQMAVPPGGMLRIRAIFEPVPLYMVLGKQGFVHWTERLADDDWRVWFYRGDAAAAGESSNARSDVKGPDQSAADADFVVLDVRGLEPPEPMTRTLELLEQLPEGQSLLQINERVPQFLMPILEERGFEYVLMSKTPNEVRGLIRRK